MDLDAVLPYVGEFGTYQQVVIWFVLLPGVIPCGFHAYNQLFMAVKPEHWCRVPELQHLLPEQEELIKNISIPLEERDGRLGYSQCYMKDLNYTQILEDRLDVWSPANQTEDASLIPCQNGWNYDLTKYKSTVIAEWDLVCSKDLFPTMSLVLLGIGGLIGNFIFGYIQDGLGRRPAFFIYLFIQCAFGIATAFAKDYITWTVFRIGVGFTVPAILGTPYVLAIELVGPRHRTICTILINIAYSLSLVMLSGLVWLVRDWRTLALATTVPFLLLFLFWCMMPESPRWLLAQGRYDEAEIILDRMARVNGKTLPANHFAELRYKLGTEQPSRKVYNYGVLDLFRTPNLRMKTTIITFIWFTNTSVYVGLSYYAPVLGGDQYLNFFLAAAAELPTYLFLWPSMEKLGRRWTLCISMVVGGTACLATFLVTNDSVVTLTLYCVGKMGISSSFVVLPLMASELYPTVVRGLGMSISSVLGMLGPVCIPLVNYLGTDMLTLPLIIMGTLLIMGGACSLLLPETLHKHLPQTLEDGERVGLDYAICCAKKKTNFKDSKHEETKL